MDIKYPEGIRATEPIKTNVITLLKNGYVYGGGGKWKNKEGKLRHIWVLNVPTSNILSHAEKIFSQENDEFGYGPGVKLNVKEDKMEREDLKETMEDAVKCLDEKPKEKEVEPEENLDEANPIGIDLATATPEQLDKILKQLSPKSQMLIKMAVDNAKKQGKELGFRMKEKEEE